MIFWEVHVLSTHVEDMQSSATDKLVFAHDNVKTLKAIQYRDSRDSFFVILKLIWSKLL